MPADKYGRSLHNKLGSAYKVVLSDNDWPSLDLEKQLFGKYNINFSAYNKINKETLLSIAEEIDALIIEYTRVDREVITNLAKCKIISVNGVGVDSIDLKAATECGICVANVPDYCIEEVAVHTVTLLLSCVRKIVYLDRKVRERNWSYKNAMPVNSLKNKILGIIALGKIGSRVAQIMQVFGYKIITYNPLQPAKAASMENVRLAGSLQELLEKADVVSIHCPLVPETRNLIHEEQLRIMKPDAILINTSRGGIVNEKALYKALKEGKIAAAGLDVMEKEPPDPHNPLLTLENIIITPHAAFYSEEAMEEVRIRAANEVVRVLVENRLPMNLVNKDVSPRFQQNKDMS